MNNDWTIDEVLAQCPNIDHGTAIDAIIAEASISGDLRRFLIALAYGERRKQQLRQEGAEQPQDAAATQS